MLRPAVVPAVQCDDLVTRSGLLLPRPGERAAFRHLSLQDFLAAGRVVTKTYDGGALERSPRGWPGVRTAFPDRCARCADSRCRLLGEVVASRVLDLASASSLLIHAYEATRNERLAVNLWPFMPPVDATARVLEHLVEETTASNRATAVINANTAAAAASKVDAHAGGLGWQLIAAAAQPPGASQPKAYECGCSNSLGPRQRWRVVPPPV